MARFSYRRRVEFSDTDQSGLIHFSRVFVFMEEAEHAFLRSLGTHVHIQHDGHEIGWPRVRATCEYLRPMRFEDEVDVEVDISRRGGKSLTYRFELHNRTAGPHDAPCARGEITAVCCVVDDPQGVRSTEIPEPITALLDASG